MRRRAWGLALWLVLAAPAPGQGQVFLASRPDPAFTVGPLMVRARVSEGAGAGRVEVMWSLVFPPGRGAAALGGDDLYLLWPGEVRGGLGGGAGDAALDKTVQELGFAVIGEGELPLFAQSLADGRGQPQRLPGAAPFVVFVQDGGVLGLSPPATLIRIPWSPRLAERGTLMELHLEPVGLVTPRKASWAERLFVGQRYQVAISFNEVRERPLFPMYLALRDRVLRLADAPSELAVNFADSEHLKIDEVVPPTSIRRLSETEDSTEVVSLFLDKSEGITPQQLTVRFGYFSRLQATALVLIPTLFFLLGNALGPVLGRLALRAGDAVRARVHVGAWRGGPRGRQSGVIIPRETLARIVPGQTTRQDIARLCGEEMEERGQFAMPERRTLVYRGRRVVPAPRRIFGWFSTVAHWKVERHEVRIELERDVVRDVQTEVGYHRLGADEGRPSPDEGAQ